MKLLHRSLLSLASLGAMLFSASNAHALNDYNCQSPGKFPVVVAHGRAGTVESMTAVVGALEGAGYCVYGENYGVMTPGGQTGMAHLDQAGSDFGAVVDKVLAATHNTKVDTIGYSEGGMAVDNFILAKGGAAKINRFVGFAPGHHPYGHFGIANVFDGVLFCPNVLAMVRGALPPFTSKISMKDVISLGLGLVPGLLQPADEELVKSDFVADLFEGNYWLGLHGSLSEPEGNFATVGNGKTIHTLPTKDSAPNICYTNMISPVDMLVGASAGFLDAAPNVVNVVLASMADHGTIINDKAALDGMLKSLATPCVQSGTGPANGGDGAELNGEVDNGKNGASSAENDDDDDDKDGFGMVPNSGCGCKVAPAPKSFTFEGLAGLGLVGLALARRRSRR